MVDSTLWMPAGMDPADKTAHQEAYPTDPHAAAAAAWEDWVATLEAAAATGADAEVTSTVASVATGAQSVSYAQGTSRTAITQALERASFHRARARLYSVAVGPQFEAATEVDYVAALVDGDTSDLDDTNNEALWTSEQP